MGKRKTCCGYHNGGGDPSECCFPIEPAITGDNSSHDHGNCELCDYLDSQLAALRARIIGAEQTALSLKWERDEAKQGWANCAADFREALQENDNFRSRIAALEAENERLEACTQVQAFERLLTRLTNQRDRLAEALRSVRAVGTGRDAYGDADSIVRAALAKEGL